VAGEPAWSWSALSPEESEPASPSSMDLCLSCASLTRLTQIGASGRWTVPGPMISGDIGS
jgi:hypothetical protein